MVLGLGAACLACALLCGATGVRGTRTAAAAEPLTALGKEESAGDVPSESDAISVAGGVVMEIIAPARTEQEPSAVAVPIAPAPGEGGRVEPAPVSSIAPSRRGPVAAARPSAQLAAPPGMRAKMVRMRVTAYCPCAICCGRATGITASGLRVSANGSKFAATGDERLPMGSMVSVPGYGGGRPVPVIDRMADTDQPRLDVYFPSHRRAREWGVKWMEVTVYVPAKAGPREH